MRRAIALLFVSALVSSCATLGREVPRCEFVFVDVPVSVIMQIQAIPGAEFGPCVNELAPGWDYHDMHHETGRVTFWLDSDRLGDRFLEVTMEESCDPEGAVARPYPEDRIRRFVQATEEVDPVEVAIIPTGDNTVDYAASVGVELAGVSVNGRPLRLRLDRGTGPESERIEAALDAGHFAMVIDVVDMVSATVQLWLPETAEPPERTTLIDAVEDIEDRVEEGTYRATWYHTFSGGCVVFDFDASGPGVERLVADVDAVVGFVDLAELTRRAAEEGFIVDESELE